MKKFELTSEFITNVLGTKLFRIKALVEFGDVSAGELGGYIEKEGNLSQDGNAWVYGNARVSGNARFAFDGISERTYNNCKKHLIDLRKKVQECTDTSANTAERT